MALKDLNIKWLPAHASNYTAGRSMAIDQITVHHMAFTPDSLGHVFGNPNRNASSTYGVFPTKFEQYVSRNNTPWTNGNYRSNSRSITIETYGDWRNGWTDSRTLENLKKLIKELRKEYPHAKLTFHKYETDNATVCPAQLEGWARKVWDEVTKELTTKPKPKISYRQVKKKVVLNKSAVLWDFNFTSWSEARKVKGYQKGHVVDVVAEATNQMGSKYYMTAYSYDSGAIRNTHGFNVVDTDDFVEPTPTPPPIDPEPPIEPPVVPPVEPPVEPPEEIPNWFIRFIKATIEFLTGWITK